MTLEHTFAQYMLNAVMCNPGHMHGDIPFVYDPYVFWKMGSYQNVTLTTVIIK